MNDEVEKYIMKYSDEIQSLFYKLRTLIMESISEEIVEKMWAKLPSYYVEENFVRLIPFKDHINVEARTIMEHAKQLTQFKITPKGMLQVYLKQELPEELLTHIFSTTLNLN